MKLIDLIGQVRKQTENLPAHPQEGQGHTRALTRTPHKGHPPMTALLVCAHKSFSIKGNERKVCCLFSHLTN